MHPFLLNFMCMTPEVGKLLHAMHLNNICTNKSTWHDYCNIKLYARFLLQIVGVGPDVPEQFCVGGRVCVENHFFCGHCYQCTHGQNLE